MSPVSLDVVICTYDRADDLDRALAALAAQRGVDDVVWSVLVVDNNSTDRTPSVVQDHLASGSLPGLRRVVEEQQGLTPARRRGVLETSGDWVAFVDDDNLVEPDWLAKVAAAVRDRPDVGALGGRVRLAWVAPPPSYLREFGFCYAAQDLGGAARAVEHLNGAGMVVRRTALAACGWVDQPLVADRVGRRLVSGGDVEIGARIRAAGYLLWYDPSCVLRHRIEDVRMRRRHLLRIAAGLGASESLMSLLTWDGTYPAWRHRALGTCGRHLLRAARRTAGAARGRTGVTTAAAWTAYAVGSARGLLAVRSMETDRRRVLLGAAAPRARSADRIACSRQGSGSSADRSCAPTTSGE